MLSLQSALSEVKDARAADIWRTVQAGWASLTRRNEVTEIGGLGAVREQTQLLGALRQLSQSFVYDSGLILDPKAESYFLVKVGLVDSPFLVETLTEMQAIVLSISPSHPLGAVDKARLTVLASRADVGFSAIEESLVRAVYAEPALKSTLEPALRASMQTATGTRD